MSAEAAQLVTEATKPDVLGTLGINWKLLLAQLVNVGVVVFALWKWVFTPLMKLLDERSKKIELGLKHAKEADERLREAKDKEHALMAEARAEARAIIDAAVAGGEKERAARVEKSKSDVDAQIEEAKAKIGQERLEALETVRREVADLVMLATRKVSTSALHESAQRSYLEQTLRELEDNKI